MKVKLTPAEARVVSTTLRWATLHDHRPAGVSLELIEKFVKFGDGGEIEPQQADGATDYTTFVIGKASSQSMEGVGLPPGVHLDPFHAQMLTGVLGSIGELGELADHIKKYMFHGWQEHPLDMEYIKLEQGDRMWYDALLNYAFKLPLADVVKANVAKLNARYKGRATAHESAHRVEGRPEDEHQPDLAEGTSMAHGMGPYAGGAHSPNEYELRHITPETIELTKSKLLEGSVPIGRCKKFVHLGNRDERQCVWPEGHDNACSVRIGGATVTPK